MGLESESAGALNRIDDLFFLLRQVNLLRSDVLHNLSGAIEGDEGGDVVEGRVAGEEVGIGSREELLVGRLKGHDECNS